MSNEQVGGGVGVVGAGTRTHYMYEMAVLSVAVREEAEKQTYH